MSGIGKELGRCRYATRGTFGAGRCRNLARELVLIDLLNEDRRDDPFLVTGSRTCPLCTKHANMAHKGNHFEVVVGAASGPAMTYPTRHAQGRVTEENKLGVQIEKTKRDLDNAHAEVKQAIERIASIVRQNPTMFRELLMQVEYESVQRNIAFAYNLMDENWAKAVELERELICLHSSTL